MGINSILKDASADINDLINCLEEIKEAGNVVVIKFDGLRTSAQYTLFITPSINSGREIIRVDGQSLREVLLVALSKFMAQKE